MRFDLRKRTEKQRRQLTIGAGAVLLLGMVWIATQAVADAAPAEADEMWTRFGIAAVIIAVPWSAFVWRKLSDPSFADWKVDPQRYFFLFVGLGLLLRRQLFQTPGSVMLLAGASVGWVAATVTVYVYDLTTNALSRGRSWHYPNDPDQHLEAHSKTRSPT